MAIRSSDFFNKMNTVSGITENDYAGVTDTIETLLDSMSQISNTGFYIIDYFKQNFLYVSDAIACWCGIPADKVKELGYNLYTEHVPPEDLEMLKEINESGFKLYETIPQEERKKYSISYDFRFNNSHCTLINHRLTPLSMRDGKIWLALCSVTLSAVKEPGRIIMKKNKDRSFYEYSLQYHKWQKKMEPPLSDVEKKILLLTAEGYTCEEIAELIFKSLNTIRTYRKNLLKKFNTPSMSAALVYAINYGLL